VEIRIATCVIASSRWRCAPPLNWGTELAKQVSISGLMYCNAKVRISKVADT
jgi:hypothetical protein